ncbi:MAG: hypothetical protein EBT86_09440 [Actinobacteria bacterium]|nr:hypothetical protein [Actinomycetota bacterium]
MKQIKYTSQDFVPEEQIPDTVLCDQDIRNLQVLAGLQPTNAALPENMINISHTAMEKVNLMKQHDIKPGTPEWFKLWFSRPYWFKENI